MTDEDLRSLLRERVEDLTTTDLSGTAWRAGRRVRSRRRRGAIVGVAAATLAVVGVAAIVGGRSDGDGDPGPSSSTPTPSPTPGPAVDEPDAAIGGAAVFWSPDPAAEGDLPTAEGVLPASIDLSRGAPLVEDAPIARASAAFAVFRGSGFDRVVLVTSDGLRTLDLPSATNGRAVPRLTDSGTALNLTGGGTAMTYSFESGRWLGERVGEEVSPEVPPQVAAATAYGPPKRNPSGSRTARAYGYGSEVPAPPGSIAQPETIVVTPAIGPPTILAIDMPAGTGARWNQCCPVAGWLDDDTVVYESRGAEPRLVGWDVGTHDFELVSRIVGLAADELYVATFASLDGYPSGDAAETSRGDADATAQGVPVWWSPDLDQEVDLPWIDEDGSPLPREIDATAELPDVADEPIDRALAAFRRDPLRPGGVALLATDGTLRSLDISRLAPLRDRDGNASSVANATMLSPDGRHLVFAQRGHVMVYALASGEWSRIETGSATTGYVTWADDRTVHLPPGPAGGSGPLFDLTGERVGTDDLAPEKAFDVAAAFDNTEGPWRTNHAGDAAQSWGMGGPFLPVRDRERYLSGPAYLSVVGPEGARALAFMTGVGDVRFLDAPPVAGWLDDDTVVYESLADDRDLLIAWDVGTREFRRVATITGSTGSSFADLRSD